jgi:hypothetical protein
MAFSPTITEGARATAETNLYNGVSSRRGFSFDTQITELEPNVTPFVSTLMAYKRKAVNDPDYKYQEHRPAWLDSKYIALNDTISCSATFGGQLDSAVTVTDSDWLSDTAYTTNVASQRWILQLVDADDTSKFCNFLLYGIDSSTQIDLIQLTDTPGFNGAAGDKLHIIGSAFAEGTPKTIATYDKVDVKWASCQIFKTLVKASLTTMKTWVAGGNEWERLQAEGATNHKVDMERDFLFGSRCINEASQGSANDPFGAPVAIALAGGGVGTARLPVRTSISIQQAARWADSVGMGGSRVFNNTESTYDYDQFIDDMQELFEFGNDSRYFFGGQSVLSILTKMALDTDTGMTYENGVNEAGVKYRKFLTPHGDLKFVRHKLFRGDYAKKAFAVDMNNIELLVFDGTFVEENVETPGYDGQENQILSDMGLKIGLPESTVAEFNWV